MRATAFRNFKRIIAVLAIICLMFSLMPANTFAVAASDISGHWAQVKIQSWMDKGLIKGYPDGTFKPDQHVTRVEFMTLANRAFGYTAVVPITYTDVKAGSWYAPEVAKAKAAGYISGYPDGTMKPENPITREEVATIVARIKNLTSDANAADKYTDASKIGSWSKGQVGAVTSAKIMRGYPDGSFMPQGLMTRAEVVEALDNALHYTAPVVVTPPVVTPPVVTPPVVTPPVVTPPVVPVTYPVTFTVEDATYAKIDGASVAIVSQGTIATDVYGRAIFYLADGTYAYDVTKTGYVTKTDSAVVAGAAKSVSVIMTASPVAVSAITVTGAGDAITVVNGGTLAMSAAVLPADATDPSVTWSVTAGTGTATIDATTGMLTGTGVGTVTVTATANDGSGITGTEAITVTAALGSDATLKASSTVKGVTLLSLGRSSASGDIWSDGGKVTITAAEAANTTNLITLFDPTDAEATVKVVKFSWWQNVGNFDSALAYANQAITDQDYFWVKVKAPDTTTLYYKVEVTVTPAPVTNETQLRAALANTNITTISLGANIALTSPLTISRTVTIDGLGKSITGSGSGTTPITITAGTVTLKNVTLTGTENLQTGDGNYGIMVQGGSLVADSIHMTVATDNADNNVGFNVASGANLDLRNSLITITDAGGNQQQYAVYAQSGAGVVALTSNTFSFNAGNASGHYSYLIGMEGDLVANYPGVTLTGTNTNNAYIKLLLVGADTLANKEAYAEAGDKVAVGERLGIIGTDQGIYYRLVGSWVQ